MPVTSTQKSAIEEVMNTVISATGTGRGKRQFSAMFMDLVDRTEWPQYYEVIPEPRCLNNIKAGLEKGRYKDVMDVYTDLSLVFWNALFYNEPESQIAKDAETLKAILETEWKKKPVLPPPRTTSPPPSSAQKVHHTVTEDKKPTISITPTSVPTKVPTPAPAATPAPRRTATPITQPIPTQSTYNYTYTKPVPIRPRSAQRQPSPEIDIDISGMSPEPDSLGEGSGVRVGAERNAESEEIVRQLEKGLPRWPGFGNDGWMEEIASNRLVDIVHAIKSHKDIIGNRLAVALEAIPEESTIQYLSSTFPHSLKLIENRARSGDYANAKEFDLAMVQLFEKARRWHEPGSEAYGRVLLLQRLYQALTSADPPLGPPYLSSTNFAALRAGPGNTKPVHGSDAEGVPGVTTHRVLTKDRTFVDEVHYKGWSLKLADWVHLSNPDDPSRPIIGQVFRCWLSDELSKKGQPGLTVSWYFRPEQTFHPANRHFWEGEVFKTSHFADHPLEDVIEKIACQFTARHIRGRPRPPFWYLGFPLYVCDSRYNDRDRVFVKIKNWNSCVPEEVRQSTEFMPIYPFERTVFPNRMASPFLSSSKSGKAVKGPGGLLEASAVTIEQGDTESGRKRTRRPVGGDAGPNKGLYIGASAGSAQPGLTAALSQHQYQPLQHQQYQGPSYQQQPPRAGGGADRSVITACGGVAVLGANAQIERLPSETTRHFDRDPETNEVLWFAAPPMNMARPAKPKHSLAYLHFLAAQKRKREGRGDSGDETTIDDDRSVTTSNKRSRLQVAPTATETLRAILQST